MPRLAAAAALAFLQKDFVCVQGGIKVHPDSDNSVVADADDAVHPVSDDPVVAEGSDDAILPDAEEEEVVLPDVTAENLSDHQLRRLHRRLDGNSDGQVSLGELLSYAQRISKEIADKDVVEMFAEMDLNRDGAVSLMEHFEDMDGLFEGEDAEQDEAQEQRKVLEAGKFKAADANGDGLLQPNELAAMFYPETSEAVLQITVADTLHSRDLDRDGQLSPQEFFAADAADGEDFEPSAEELADFATLDKDKNGFLDLGEFWAWESGHFHTEKAMKKMFDLADANGDSELSIDELLRARAGLGASSYLTRWAEHMDLDSQSSAGEL